MPGRNRSNHKGFMFDWFTSQNILTAMVELKLPKIIRISFFYKWKAKKSSRQRGHDIKGNKIDSIRKSISLLNIRVEFTLGIHCQISCGREQMKIFLRNFLFDLHVSFRTRLCSIAFVSLHIPVIHRKHLLRNFVIDCLEFHRDQWTKYLWKVYYPIRDDLLAEDHWIAWQAKQTSGKIGRTRGDSHHRILLLILI